MTLKTLKYTAHTTRAGYRQLDKALLQFGVLYNVLITHRRSRSSTHRHVKYLNIQNFHITDLHRNDPVYTGFARRLLVSTAKRVNTAFARPHLVPGAGYPDTKDPHCFNTLEVSEPGTNHLKISEDGRTATLSVKGLPTVWFNTDQRMRQVRPRGRDLNPETVPEDGIPRDVQPRTFRITRTPRRLTVTMVFETEHLKLSQPQVDSVGIDPGVKNLITTSDSEGTVTHIPGLDDRPHRKVLKRLKRKAQRQRDSALKEERARFVTQKTREGKTKRRFRWVGKPSSSYLKNQAQLRRVEQKRSDSRHGLQHRLTTELVRTYRHICMEDTQIHNMTGSAKGTAEEPGTRVRQKAGLNREILSQGWYGFKQKFEYKCAWNDRIFTPVPARWTSTTCGNCGHSEKANRPTQERFHCRKCNYEANADANAAENIRRRGITPARADDWLGNQPCQETGKSGRTAGPRKGNKRTPEGRSAGPTHPKGAVRVN